MSKPSDPGRPAQSFLPAPGFFRIVFSPWIDLIRPARAGATFAAAPTASVWCAGLPYGCVIAVAVVVLSLRAQMVEQRRLPGRGGRPQTTVVFFSISEVWADWHRDGWFGSMELIGLGIMALVGAIVVIVALFQFPVIHAGGELGRSYVRALRAAVASLGLLALLTVVAGSMLVWAIHTEQIGPRRRPFNIFPFAIMTILACAASYYAWLGAAARGAREPEEPHDLPPRCEGCGYDLTHRPEHGRCPECNLPIEESLTPGRRRPGWAWEQKQVFGAWLEASARALLEPTRFYGALTLRGDDRAARVLARSHLLLVGFGAALWVFVLVVTELGRPGGDDVVVVPMLLLFLAPLAGWMVHRVVGTLVALGLFVRGVLPDPRWFRKVLGYEMVYLWTFCGYNGALLTGFIRFHDALYAAIGRRVPFGATFVPIELVLVFAGNGALILLWLARYRRAVRAVRFSNF